MSLVASQSESHQETQTVLKNPLQTVRITFSKSKNSPPPFEDVNTVPSNSSSSLESMSPPSYVEVMATPDKINTAKLHNESVYKLFGALYSLFLIRTSKFTVCFK